MTPAEAAPGHCDAGGRRALAEDKIIESFRLGTRIEQLEIFVQEAARVLVPGLRGSGRNSGSASASGR